MNEDDRIHRYLADRAHSITLPPLELGTIVERSRRRQQRRRAGVGLAAAVVVIGASIGLVANRGDDKPSELRTANAAVVPSSLDWTIVNQEPGLGLGWASAFAATDDGTTYSLSTAPGVGDTNGQPASLYRSADGATWEQVGLPDGVWATGLASNGGRVYAVGTSPAGGGRKAVISSSDDGGATWSTADLPIDLAAIEAKYPKQISVIGPYLASGPNGLVATLTVRAFPDLTAVLEDLGLGQDSAWSLTPAGVVVHDADECLGGLEKNGELPERPPCVPTADRSGDGNVVQEFSWDELDVPPELQSLIVGEVYVFASTDGATFHDVTLPEGTADGASANVVADDSGYYLFANTSGPIPTGPTVLRSSDAETWEPAAGPSDVGWVMSAGLLDGRAAFASISEDGRSALNVADGSGGWTTTDLAAVLGIEHSANNPLGITEVAFGPLGFAALVYEQVDANGPGHPLLVHSADGVSLSVVDVDPLLGDQEIQQWPAGVTVTADAITLRFAQPTSDPPGEPPTKVPGQVLVVGTPR